MSTDRRTARAELGALIREQRHTRLNDDGRRMTQGRLGEQVGYSQGQVQKMEAGLATVKPDTLESIIEALHVDGGTAQRMRALAAWGAVGETYSGERVEPGYAHALFNAEATAKTVRSWHELRLPGTVQSECLMLNQFGASGTIDVTRLERTRRERKKIFGLTDLERYDCLLFEEALHHAAAAFHRMVVLDQIDHLLALNDPDHPQRQADDRTSIRIVPTTTGQIHLPGDFTIVEHRTGTLVYIENLIGAHKDRSRAGAAKATEAWLRLAVEALSRDETNTLLRKLRERYAGG